MPERDKGAIVVVDDDDGLRQALGRVLSAAGFQAETFASAETLLQSDAAGRAACLVLDIHLPGLSGFELRRTLVRTGSHQPPVIFITGHDEPAARAQAEALGAADYLPKPFAGRTLVAAVARAVGEV
jgi:FixJ family two-component response regulator